MLTFHLPCKEDNSWGISMRTSLRSEKYKLLTPLNPHFSINTLMTNTGKLISIDSLSRLSAVGKKKKKIAVCNLIAIPHELMGRRFGSQRKN